MNASSSDRDWERVFVGDRQIDVTHFYSIGDGYFSAGYWSGDLRYRTGIVMWDKSKDAFTVVHHCGKPLIQSEALEGALPVSGMKRQAAAIRAAEQARGAGGP